MYYLVYCGGEVREVAKASCLKNLVILGDIFSGSSQCLGANHNTNVNLPLPAYHPIADAGDVQHPTKLPFNFLQADIQRLQTGS